uniref:Uncharacterized protein n=1 Tax=Caenorhabditis japonica TaxID=281687 RepID=A0A8R1IB76_CAEJA
MRSKQRQTHFDPTIRVAVSEKIMLWKKSFYLYNTEQPTQLTLVLHIDLWEETEEISLSDLSKLNTRPLASTPPLLERSTMNSEVPTDTPQVKAAPAKDTSR